MYSEDIIAYYSVVYQVYLGCWGRTAQSGILSRDFGITMGLKFSETCLDMGINVMNLA